MFSLPFTVDRSIIIDKPVEDVFAAIGNFNTWQAWSPWLCQEPDARVDIDGSPGSIGHEQRWAGERIGSGHMQLTESDPNKKLGYDLNFVKPWKSKSAVVFDFNEKDEKTEVVWHMSGTVPAFLFFMRSMMAAMVGSDYERGLAMFKEYLETGQVNTRVSIQGKVDRPAFYYLGRHRICALQEVGPAMEADFEFLEKLKESEKLQEPDFHFSFYHKYDFVKKSCEYTSGYGYFTESVQLTGENIRTGHVDPHQGFMVQHEGPYRHLGNAWSTAMGCQRSMKLKLSKNIPKYEIYATLPGQVDEARIETEIYLPLK